MVDEEIVNQETTQDIQQDTVNEEQPSEDYDIQQEKNKEKKGHEYNFQALREKAQKAERDREELSRKLRMYEEQQKAVLEARKVQEEQTLQPDDLVEGKHLSKYDKKIKELEEKLSSYQQQSYQMTAEQQLKTQFPDFEKVVNEQTINDLKLVDPDLAASIGANPDLLSKARTAYNAIKRLNIYKEDMYTEDKKRAATNENKPRPLASVSPQQGDSPLSHANAFANGLTDDLKKQLLKEMTEAIKRR